MMLAAQVGSAIPLVRDRIIQLGEYSLLSVFISVLLLFVLYLELLRVLVLRCTCSLCVTWAPEGEYHT